MPVTRGHILLAAVVVQRLAELVYAHRNTRLLESQGGVEHGRGHYPYMVLLHAAWLTSIAWGLRVGSDIRPLPLVVFLILQAARVWVIWTLGRFWTTRVISMPGEPLVRRGPYRYLRHPNYVVVAGEIAVLPLVFGQVTTALVFSVLNAFVLAWRIHVENAALQPLTGSTSLHHRLR